MGNPHDQDEDQVISSEQVPVYVMGASALSVVGVTSAVFEGGVLIPNAVEHAGHNWRNFGIDLCFILLVGLFMIYAGREASGLWADLYRYWTRESDE